MDGIVVSNHGGRQLDGAVAALEVLPEIVDAVGGQITVMFDSGIRTGADIIKALALGAKAVMVGRPVIYGKMLIAEFARTIRAKCVCRAWDKWQGRCQICSRGAVGRPRSVDGPRRHQERCRA